MHKAKFSVNVPVYNAEKYLHECIDSILNQTFTDFEVLLIDDGSKDSSGAICDEYASRDSRVRVFHNKNRGSYATRVFGVMHSTGEYCSFCDSDDFYDQGYLERANELLNEEPCDMLVMRHEEYYDGVRKHTEPYWPVKRVFEGADKNEFYTAMMSSMAFNSLNIKFTKTELMQNDPLDIEKYSFVKNGDDFLQSLYPVFNAKKIVFIPECYYNYRMNPASLTHRIDPNIHNSILAVRSVIWNDYLDGTTILGENTKDAFALDSARSLMNVVKSVAQSDNITDDKKIEIFSEINNHSFYTDFIEPNLNKADLEKKWLVIYELMAHHSYKLLLSTVKMLNRIKK